MDAPYTDIPYNPPETTSGGSSSDPYSNIPYTKPTTKQATPPEIQGNQGRIGDFEVKPNSLKSENFEIVSGVPGQARLVVGTGVNAAGISSSSNPTDIVFWAGSDFATRSSAPFYVTASGHVVASDISATGGTIGGWTIGATTITSIGNPSIILDSANQQIKSSDYVAGVKGFFIGPNLIEAENLKARGMMKGVTFQYDVVSAVGGQLMIANTDTLDADMTALDASTLTVSGTTTFAVNDILLVRAVSASGIQEEYLRVTNAASAPVYTVTRDLAGVYAANSNPAWIKGTTIVKIGKSDGAATYSGGWLRLIGEGTNAPYYSVFSRAGVAYNSYSERVRVGNLNGIGGKVSDCFGIFIGDKTTNNYLMYDDVSGALEVNGRNFANDPIFGDGSDGNVTIGAGTTTLTKDMFYDHLIVNGTLNPNGFKIHAKTSIIINNGGVVNRDGNNGGNGGNGSGMTGGTAGSAGAALASGSIFGSVPGTAGVAGGGGGGGGGAATPGSNGTAGTNGLNGSSANPSLGSAASSGVAGGGSGAGGFADFGGGSNASGGTAGSAGTLTSATSGVRTLGNALTMLNTNGGTPSSYQGSPSPGGAGGGAGGGGGGGYGGAHAPSRGGAGGGGGGSGGSGSPGGVILIVSPYIEVKSGGKISANAGSPGTSGNGANGENAVTTGGGRVGGGGGGGGAGGVPGSNGGIIVLIYTTYINNGTVQAIKSTASSPGSAGSGGNGGGGGNSGNNGSNGSTASNGTDGVIIPLPLK